MNQTKPSWTGYPVYIAKYWKQSIISFNAYNIYTNRNAKRFIESIIHIWRLIMTRWLWQIVHCSTCGFRNRKFIQIQLLSSIIVQVYTNLRTYMQICINSISERVFVRLHYNMCHTHTTRHSWQPTQTRSNVVGRNHNVLQRTLYQKWNHHTLWIGYKCRTKCDETIIDEWWPQTNTYYETE